jgi:hypothetical protein
MPAENGRGSSYDDHDATRRAESLLNRRCETGQTHLGVPVVARRQETTISKRGSLALGTWHLATRFITAP